MSVSVTALAKLGLHTVSYIHVQTTCLYMRLMHTCTHAHIPVAQGKEEQPHESEEVRDYYVSLDQEYCKD